MLLRILKKNDRYYPQYWQDNKWVDGVIRADWKNFRDRLGKVFNDEILYDKEIDVSFKDIESAISYVKNMERKEKEENIKKFGEVVWTNTEL